MKAHIIENGVVVNTVVVENLQVLPNLISAENGGSIGDLWDGQTFTPQEITAAPAEPTKEELLAQLNAIAAQIQAL